MAKAEQQIADAVEVQFLRHLNDAFADRLEAVLLYGSYVHGSFRAKVSDVNVLVLLSEADPEALGRLSRSMGKLMRKYHITPLILSSGEFARSSDVFPMEYLDIRDRHRVLYGDDPTLVLSIDDKNLRHQIEHQMRGNLISLRQLVLAAHGRKRMLERELSQWYGRVAAVFRGLLRLTEADEVPSEPRALVSKVNEVLGLEPGPFMRLIAFREGRTEDADTLARDLLTRLGELVRIVDAMER
ncbi:MAG: hypothetical protein R6V29_14190 [Spirochaetia bacterium]